MDASADEYTNAIKDYSFTKEIKPLIKQCNKLLKNPGKTNLPDEEWYELLASLHYLKHIAYIPDIPSPASKNFDIVYKNLPDDKRKRFTFDDAQTEWNFLNEHELIENKKLNS